MMLAGGSDAHIVSGLVALVLRVYSGRTPAEALATDPDFLISLPTIGSLTSNRKNGIAAMTRRILDMARHAEGAAP